MHNLARLFLHRSVEVSFELDLSLNQLSGSIFLSWVTLSNFSRVYIYDNLLSGTISPFIGNMTSLVDLQLNSNQLIGHIPSSFGNLINFRYLLLFDNVLSRSIPIEIWKLKVSYHSRFEAKSI